MDFSQWTKLLTLVTVMVSIPFALVWYRMRQNYQLERELIRLLWVSDKGIMYTSSVTLTKYRKLYSQHGDSKWARDIDHEQKASLSCTSFLYSMVVF